MKGRCLLEIPRPWAAILLSTIMLSCGRVGEAQSPAAYEQARLYGSIELETQSEYSHIVVRRKGSVRTLGFIRDSGEEVIESITNLEKPQELMLDYTRAMFLSFAYLPRQSRCLIVGLGGGSMVSFLKHYEPQVHVDAVEIDPVVVEIADKYFGVRSGGNVEIITVDGIRYLQETDRRYDAIYLDAFLKPSEASDSTGVPLASKTLEFYEQIQQKLLPEGVVVFNLNPHSGVRKDIAIMRRAFPEVDVYRLAGTGYVVVASRLPQRLSGAEILKRASSLDQRWKLPYSMERIARRLEK
jgi:spermidine synthase